MILPVIDRCPGTLAPGFNTYSPSCLKRVFIGKKVSHILPYTSPASSAHSRQIFLDNRRRITISGVQEKFSIVQEKNKLHLAGEGEKGSLILKPIPNAGDLPDQMPANEHLTMQIARQVYGIETAENAMIFFADGKPAYITRRFDIHDDGNKLAMEDFASLAGRSPQTDGPHYKYLGNYLEVFETLKKFVPAYPVEALKLFKIIVFNYLFSNGDAHFKNFALLETRQGDYRLAPAYDLLNTHLHVDDSPFALVDGLLPVPREQGNILAQFRILADMAGINPGQRDAILKFMLIPHKEVNILIDASFLKQEVKEVYREGFAKRLNKLA